MRVAEIKFCDIANGPGVRTSLFVSGCSHHCLGCFNEQAQDFCFGSLFDSDTEQTILTSLEPHYIEGLTILGGEPMEPSNQEALAPLLQSIHKQYPDKSIWLYTGDTFEDLVDKSYSRHTAYTDAILNELDVLVDGLFIEDQKDITLRFRGSSNQRLIDVKKSLDADTTILWQDDAIFATHKL